MAWTKDSILTQLRKLHKAGTNLSYNAMQKKLQPLVSAAAYHFGSYRQGVTRAGIDYAEVLRRPRWTKAGIVKAIKAAKRRGFDLNWSSVTRRRDELGKAAFASLQKRLFGRWEKALSAAGLNAAEVNRYRKWTKPTIAKEIKSLHRKGSDVSSGAMQKTDPGLHAAAVRYFKRYDLALLSAGIDPEKVRHRRKWDRSEVTSEIKHVGRSGKNLSDTSIRKTDPALYGAAVRLFGSYIAARKAAGITVKKSK